MIGLLSWGSRSYTNASSLSFFVWFLRAISENLCIFWVLFKIVKGSLMNCINCVKLCACVMSKTNCGSFCLIGVLILILKCFTKKKNSQFL